MNHTNINLETIKILIVDDRKMIRETIKMQLESELDLLVVGSAENGIIALQKIEQLQPDIVIIDLEMPGMDGITAIEIISERFPNTKSLVLSSHDGREYINQAIVAGAKGYLLKGTSSQDLTHAIRTINKGYFQLGSGLSGKLSLNTNSSYNYPKKTSKSKLTATESDIINSSDSLETELANKLETIINSKINYAHNDLVELLGHKINNLTLKQREINLNLQTTKKYFYLLLITQVFSLIVLIIK